MTHSVHPPLSAGGRVEPPTKFSKWGGGGGGGLSRTLIWRGGDLFERGGCNFYIKNKLKSEIFDEKKKFINKNVFPCHN